jgi:hypothetical protein
VLIFYSCQVVILLRLFGIERRPLETFLLQRIEDVRAGQRNREVVFEWLLEESEERGVVVAHYIITTLSLQAIKRMFEFVAECSEGNIFSFLMLRAPDGNSIGHALFGETRFNADALVREGVSISFFSCLKKLPVACRDDLLNVTVQEQTLRQVIDLMGQANAKTQSDYAWSMCPAEQIRRESLVSNAAGTSLLVRAGSFRPVELSVDTDVPNPPYEPPPLYKKQSRRKRTQSNDATNNHDWTGPPI